MTASQINESFRQIMERPYPEFQLNFNWYVWGVTAIVGFVIYAVYRQMIATPNDGKKETKIDRCIDYLVGAILTLVASLLLALFLSAVISGAHTIRAQNGFVDETGRLIDQWKQEEALPYLEALPKEKNTLLYLKIDPEIETTIEGASSLGFGDVSSSSELLTPMVMSYDENGTMITQTQKFPSAVDLKAETKPYVEFTKLKEPLGVIDRQEWKRQICGLLNCLDVGDEIYAAGNYNYVVHLPKGYKFTEIK